MAPTGSRQFQKNQNSNPPRFESLKGNFTSQFQRNTSPNLWTLLGRFWCGDYVGQSWEIGIERVPPKYAKHSLSRSADL